RASGLSFVEAVEKLAAEANLEIPQSTPAERELAKRQASLHEVVETAAVFFERQLRLPAGREALDYLRRRGLDDNAITRYRLGYAPAGNALKAALGGQGGIPIESLVAAGLVGTPDDGRAPYDTFRDRVMFPIGDHRGRLIAFGGRVMGDKGPKYLNSPDTPLFQKGEVLYGLAQARAAVYEKGTIVVVEGYMDVIALAQAGLANAVAPLGTALTESQIEALWRLAPEPILCFDGDAAGQRAARRAAERALPLLKAGLSLRFAVLPPGCDPDELVRTQGARAMADIFDGAESLFEVVWRHALDGRSLDTPERRAALTQDIETTVSRIADTTVQYHYRRFLRDRLWQLFNPPRQPRGSRQAGRSAAVALVNLRPGAKRLEDEYAQRVIVAFVLKYPGLLVQHVEEITAMVGGTGPFARLVESATEFLSGEPEMPSEILLAHLNTPFAPELGQMQSQFEALALKRVPDPEAEFQEIMDKIHAQAISLELKSLHRSMVNNATEEEMRSYLAQRNALVRETKDGGE
ncbi:MAG: DNA primase, partial [Alphaproteobacteria bacterium]|nr:DNA primase [Alphaproteobacteria bacterium]